MKLGAPVVINRELSQELQDSFAKDFTKLYLGNPTIDRLLLSKKKIKNPWLSSNSKILRRISSEGIGGNGISVIEVETNGVKRITNAFIKAAHILEPITYMKKQYDEKMLENKFGEPMNKAYIDAFASCIVGNISNTNISPHFCEYYGSFGGIAKKYYYDISDEYESFRNKRWFWKNKEDGEFDIKCLKDNSEYISDELQEIFEKPDDDELLTDSESDSDSEVELPLDELTLDNESIHSASVDFKSESEESQEYSDYEDSFEIFTELKDFPVMLICIEKNDDTMDKILLEEEYDDSWEDRWLAWMFQIVAALIQIQELLQMTHNDLHTNNILWIPTEEKYLYYKENSGQVWRVPTYGKLFRIIDFGRSIFTIDNKLYYSDDFLKNNDADEQYNFGPFYDSKYPKVEPNVSFDLSRLATGLYEGLYDKNSVNEPEHHKLHDMLWSWMLDDENISILYKENGDDRFPGFDLYQHIAAHVHGAVPKEQLKKGWFSNYRIKTPVGVKMYSLFV